MNKYEITIITKEDEKEEAVKKEIETLNGKIISADSLGQKQLTFPIKKETAGYYTAVLFEMEPEKVVELDRKLSLKNEIIRHLIISSRIDRINAQAEAEKAAREESTELAKSEKTEPVLVEAPLAEKPVEIKEEKKVDLPETPAEEPKAKPKTKKTTGKAAKTAEAEAKKEVSTQDRLKALDEKLDELLKE